MNKVIHEGERLAHSALNALPQHVAVLDDTGLIIAVNQAWRDFAINNAATIENLVEGVNYLEVCDRADGADKYEATNFAAGLRSVINLEESEFWLEYSCHSPSTKRWFIGRIAHFQFNGSTRIVVTHENITARREAEEKLRQDEERCRAFFETSRDGILVEDDEIIIYVNQAYTRLLGYDSPAELLGKHVSIVLSAEHMEQMLEFGKRRLQGETTPTLYHFWGNRKDKTLVDLEASVSVFKLSDKAYIMTTVRALAERRIIEHKLFQDRSPSSATEKSITLLSWREREVLRLIATGRVTKEIAASLNISESTIKTHRKNIMRKLDIHDMVGLTHFAIQVGLVRIG